MQSAHPLSGHLHGEQIAMLLQGGQHSKKSRRTLPFLGQTLQPVLHVNTFNVEE